MPDKKRTKRLSPVPPIAREVLRLLRGGDLSPRLVSLLESLTADLDREFVADRFGPLTPSDRRLWEKARRKR